MKKKTQKNTSPAASRQLIETYGLEEIQSVGKKYGMYETGRRLNCSPYVIRHLAHTHHGKRPAERCPHLVQAVQAGRAEAGTYKNLDWSNVRIHKNQN